MYQLFKHPSCNFRTASNCDKILHECCATGDDQ